MSSVNAESFDFSTTLGNAFFATPIFTASGCASSGKELAQFFPLRDIGAVVTKSVMNKPRHGRPTPRMAETPSGMLNSIGLQGPGIDAFLAKDVPWLVEEKARVVVSIAGETVEGRQCGDGDDGDRMRDVGQRTRRYTQERHRVPCLIVVCVSCYESRNK